jgi:hypothetical protein
MDRHYTNQTCEPCLARFIGPALERVIPNTDREDWCAGCGQTTTVVRASYWYPWPTCWCDPDDHDCGTP